MGPTNLSQFLNKSSLKSFLLSPETMQCREQDFFPIVPKKFFSKYPSNYFFSKREPKGDLFRLKIISEGTKLVFICPMQGLLLSFIVIAASKFLDFSSCPFVPPSPSLLLYLGIWVHVRTENNSRLYITPCIDNR